MSTPEKVPIFSEKVLVLLVASAHKMPYLAHERSLDDEHKLLTMTRSDTLSGSYALYSQMQQQAAFGSPHPINPPPQPHHAAP